MTKATTGDRQKAKYSLNMAGEFLVAGELCRRGVHAAVTYGNAKKADVIAVDGKRATSVEVKCTSKEKWVLGNSMPEESDQLWVLVYSPEDSKSSPRYYVLQEREILAILKPGIKAYRKIEHKQKKPGVPPKGVYSIRRTAVAGFEGLWDKVSDQISTKPHSSRIAPADTER